MRICGDCGGKLGLFHRYSAYLNKNRAFVDTEQIFVICKKCEKNLIQENVEEYEAPKSILYKYLLSRFLRKRDFSDVDSVLIEN